MKKHNTKQTAVAIHCQSIRLLRKRVFISMQLMLLLQMLMGSMMFMKFPLEVLLVKISISESTKKTNWSGSHASAMLKWNGIIKDNTTREGIYRYEIRMTTTNGTRMKAEGEFCLLLNNENKNTSISRCEQCTFPDMIDPRNGFLYETAELLDDCE